MIHNRKGFKWIFYSDNRIAYTGSKFIFLQLFSSSPSSSTASCLKVEFAYTATYDDVADPRAVVSPPIPPCDVKLPCFEFVWSGNDSSRIASIVSSILANNPGHIIPSEKNVTVKQTAQLIYQTALMESGFVLNDPKDFAYRIYESVKSSLDISPDAAVEEEDYSEEVVEVESEKKEASSSSKAEAEGDIEEPSDFKDEL